ncbi:unnamed protein product [Arabis nemorensis]|uniref:Uncharacterized protein n=1 Tax=Arabis nemorensis TaxID=586526 RepID=A0A565BI56_9BRAS|nr:unnamed protein product [Arabis nemorensis]
MMMSVYASVIIREGKTTNKDTIKTPIVECAYRNLRWDHEVKFSLDAKLVREFIASNPLPPLTNGNGDKMKLVIRPVKVTGGTEAKLSFSYRFKPALADNLYPSLSSSFRYPTVHSGRLCENVVNPPQFQTPMRKLALELVIKTAKDIKDVGWMQGRA